MALNCPRCPECDGQLRTDADETVCADCGLVVDTDRIDHGPEWRSFDDSRTTPKRTGAPLTEARHDRGLSTEIGYASGLSEHRRRKFIRLRRQHNRARVGRKRDRNKIYAFQEIRQLTGDKSLPESVRDQACKLFRSAQKESLLQGRSLEGFAAACVYAACRINTVSRTIEETVADPTGGDRQRPQSKRGCCGLSVHRRQGTRRRGDSTRGRRDRLGNTGHDPEHVSGTRRRSADTVGLLL